MVVLGFSFVSHVHTLGWEGRRYNSGQIHHHMGGICGWIVSLEKVPNWVHHHLAAEK